MLTRYKNKNDYAEHMFNPSFNYNLSSDFKLENTMKYRTHKIIKRKNGKQR